MSYLAGIHFSIIFPLTPWSTNRSLPLLNNILYTFITRLPFLLHDTSVWSSFALIISVGPSHSFMSPCCVDTELYLIIGAVNQYRVMNGRQLWKTVGQGQCNISTFTVANDVSGWTFSFCLVCNREVPRKSREWNSCIPQECKTLIDEEHGMVD